MRYLLALLLISTIIATNSTIAQAQTATPEPVTSAYVEVIPLPSGNVAHVQMTATAGELFIAGVLLLVVFILLWPAIGAIAQMNSRR
jgi:hypothetical protein